MVARMGPILGKLKVLVFAGFFCWCWVVSIETNSVLGGRSCIEYFVVNDSRNSFAGWG